MLDYMLACPADAKAFVLRHKGNTAGLRADDPEGGAGADCRSVACHGSTRICGRAPTRPRSGPPGRPIPGAWNHHRDLLDADLAQRALGESVRARVGAAAVVEETPPGSMRGR